MSDRTPTERLDVPAEPEAKRRRGLLYSLLGVAALLIIGLVVLVVALLGKGSGQLVAAESPSPSASLSPAPSASSEASETPSAAPSPSPNQTNAAPPPPSTKPKFTSFQAPNAENGCGAGPYVSYNPPVKVKWATANADSVWFVEGTSDAVNSHFKKGPASGNQDNFQGGPASFGCDGQTHTYTLTILGKDGSHVSKHWTVKDTSHH
jgi:hypothetical protein